MNQKVTTERFLEQAHVIHGDKYDYPANLVVTQIESTVSITCKVHGTTFDSSYRKHIVGKAGCMECGRNNTKASAIRRRGSKESFVEKARAVHGDTYNYDRVVYTTCKAKVEIICSEHGVFQQSPNMHTSNKQGCPECYEDRRHLGNRGFRVRQLLALEPMGYLYVVRFSCPTGSYIKLGITTRDVKQRWGKDTYMGQEIEVLQEVPMSLREAYALEAKGLAELAQFLDYKAGKLRNGNTECFVDTPELVDKLLEIIRK